VGGAAQTKAMRKIAAPLRTELAQYRELASFAQFSADLDKDTSDRLHHGERIIEVLKQGQYAPASLEQMILVFFAATNRFFTDTEVGDIADRQKKMIRYFENNQTGILDELRDKKDISPELEVRIKDALEQFRSDSGPGLVGG
jgi:F-type H+-transporting ATPase subunit alpha